MKILYITTVDLKQNSGVRKKIIGQVRAIRDSGHLVKIVSPRGKRIAITDEKKIDNLGDYNGSGPLRFFNLSSSLYQYSYDYLLENKYNAVFIRYSISDWNLLKLLKRLKGNGIKIFIEIPSYPYDLEYKNKQLYKRIGLYIDRLFRIKLHQYVDMIFTPSPDQKNIYGIKTVFFENGIDTTETPKREYSGFKEGRLRFIGVANINAWHGYDRVITGIAKYYEQGGDKDIIFNVVGEGVELPNLKKIAKELNIENRIIFYGSKYGEDLDEIYNQSDIAVTSIGFFRLNSMKRTSLKTREACLKGIPFISVKGDPTFDNGFKYIYTVEDRDVPVDIESIYNWFSKLDSNVYMKEIREFALKNLGWNKTFRNVILEMEKCLKN